MESVRPARGAARAAALLFWLMPATVPPSQIEERTKFVLSTGDTFSGKVVVRERAADLPMQGILRHCNGAVFRGTFSMGCGTAMGS